jgi:hypothetical protein
MAGAENPVLAFTDSRAIDDTGRQVMPSYQSYYFESGVKELAMSGIWEGEAFARRVLSVRNLIPNVSAVLWRREALLRALDDVPDIAKWRLAGDWRLYMALLAGKGGSVVYVAEPLNTHRRHSDGVTQNLDARAHVEEIAAMHKVAQRALNLDETAHMAQADYADRITRQLNITKRKSAKVIVRKRNV